MFPLFHPAWHCLVSTLFARHRLMSNFTAYQVRQSTHTNNSDMQITSLLTTLALAASASAIAIAIPGVSPDLQLAQDSTYALACGQRNPAVNKAISNFCTHNIVVDSTANSAVRQYRGPGVQLNIDGPACPSNSVWVPGQFCQAQFHYICAMGDGSGMGKGWYGTNGCQTWTISPWAT